MSEEKPTHMPGNLECNVCKSSIFIPLTSIRLTKDGELVPMAGLTAVIEYICPNCGSHQNADWPLKDLKDRAGKG